MLVSETKVRVRYSETDQMGIVYYGNYPQYYEVGRVETLRKLGMTYKEMETKGIFMPITSMNLKYIKPALYDDLLTVKTIITEIPNMRIQFFYEIYNEQGVLLNMGETVLAFVNIKTRRPCPAPDWFLSVMQQNWDTDQG
jgi:acyl-CoA thioester hydrolase